jgi:hypothetical protein
MVNNSVQIKHFLNKETEPVAYRSDNYYPLFVQITLHDKTAKIKSRIDDHLKIYKSNLEKFTQGDKKFQELINSGYFSQKNLDNITNNQVFPIYNLLEDEIYVISKLIDFKLDSKKYDYILQNLSREYEIFTLEISDVFDNYIKNQYLEEVKSVFIRSIDKEKEKVIFKIANYLIHFINWNNSFYDFYDSTFEVFPSALKKIENRFSAELRTNIKAYMAYYNNINMLKRHFGKKEQGKISTLSLLDWQTDIKEILKKQFTKFFGRRKAAEYINCLNKIVLITINKN